MSEQGYKALVVEDEAQMRKFLRVALASQGYVVIEALDGAEGLTKAAMHNPDVVLLDLGLPDMDGLEVVTRLREWSGVPVIVVSARGQESDKIAALDGGADDYLTKPFSAGELLARMRASLRRASNAAGPPETIFTHGALTVDMVKRVVTVAGQEARLTPIEYKLLTILIRHAGKVLTHRQLLKEAWGPNCVEHTHYLRVYMAQLRHKIESDPARPEIIITEPGVGYRLVEA